MSKHDIKLVSLLCDKIGIKTLGDLEAFKNKMQVKDNKTLLRRLALAVASDMSLKEILESEIIK